MTNPENLRDLTGATVQDTAGDKIGKVGQIYVNDDTGQPEWVTVSTGMFGNKESFAPLSGAQIQPELIVVGVGKDVVKGAPRVDNDGHLEEAEQQDLYDYYADFLGAGRTGTTGDAGETGNAAYAGDAGQSAAPAEGRRDRAGEPGVEGRDTSGPTTDDAMTRSEERLTVGTEKVTAGRARLRKYVVTENVTQTVPVSHEEVRVEREPITDANRGDAMAGGDLTEEEHEVTLNAERPVVNKETVPVERVRLGTETVTGEQTVNEDVRKEQIDTSDVEDRGTSDR